MNFAMFGGSKQWKVDYFECKNDKNMTSCKWFVSNTSKFPRYSSFTMKVNELPYIMSIGLP